MARAVFGHAHSRTLNSNHECLGLDERGVRTIRSEHPSRLIMEEAALIENVGEAFDIAISSKVPKVKVISSAAPGWFYNVTKHAQPCELPL